MLRSLLGFMCVADDEGHEAMAVVDALMFYLKNISATWVDILPTNVYCRSIGQCYL